MISVRLSWSQLLFGVAIGLMPAAARADIYQYTDKDGVVHFSTGKPQDPQAKVVIKSAPPKAAAFAPQDRDPSRYTRFDEWIRQAAALYQIPEQLVRAVIKVESDYDPRAVSYAGARGLMQLMPGTAADMGVDDVYAVDDNIDGGVRYLALLLDQFNGDVRLATAAYNAGPANVQRYGGVPPFPETQAYVSRVNILKGRYKARG